MNKGIVAFLLVDAVVVVAVVAFFFLRGSGFDVEEVPVSSLPPTHAAIALWHDGNQAEAVSLLVEGNAGTVETTHTIPTLNMSEADFMAQGERAIIEARKFDIAVSQAARDMARALMEQAAAARDAGNPAHADEITFIAEDLANELMRPNKTLFWKQQGDAIKRHDLAEPSGEMQGSQPRMDTDSHG